MTTKKNGNNEKEQEAPGDTATAELPPVRTEMRLVRHDLTPQERQNAGSDLAREIGKTRGVEQEFDQVKASYKARATECETRIDSLSTLLMNGFEMRQKACRVEFRPKDGKKDYFLPDHTDGDPPVLTEDMTAEDFQQDLIQAESGFECREEIQLWLPAGSDRAVMAVGRLKDMWFAALRVHIGHRKIEERLDSEQACAKKRIDMIKRSAKRLQEWLVTTLGKDAAKGFEEAIYLAVEKQKEREE